jgi:hypothetical protein
MPIFLASPHRTSASLALSSLFSPGWRVRSGEARDAVPFFWERAHTSERPAPVSLFIASAVSVIAASLESAPLAPDSIA